MRYDPVAEFVRAAIPLNDRIVEMHLFGSRAREDSRPDSDYDILLVVENKDDQLLDRLYDFVMDILLASGKLVSLKVFTQKEFDRLKSIPTPFMSRVLSEGRKLAKS
jgi:uncharacterized protein